jgi:two-component sensor histidine kinase
LQTLANILRQFQAQDLAQNQLLKELQNLNEEIRQVSEHLKLETVQREEILRLGDGSVLDLNWSMQELLYRVYTLTLQREVHCLATHKVVSIRHFDPIEEQYVSRELKREVCQFLEEAICNIAKHAQGVTRIEAKGMLDKKGMYYTLEVQDNGTGTFSKHKGTGTKQGYDLATKLGGKFQREAVAEKGTLCKLTWPLAGRYYCAFGQIKCKIKAVVLKGLKPKFRRKIKAVVLKGLKSKFYK